jgi:YihY family inner membrane protein
LISFGAALHRIDAYQQRHPWLAFVVAVGHKFRIDQAGYLATLVAYYAFFSLFPLLLVLVSILGFVLGNNSEFRDRILSSVLATQIPVIGSQINRSITNIEGSGLALVLGAAGILIAGTAVIHALQHGMNEIWGVPRRHRPKAVVARLQALAFLAVLGTGVVASTLVAGIGGTGRGIFPLGLRIAGLATSVALNFCLFLIAFRFLTTARITLQQVVPGAVLAAFLWAAMQVGGGWVIRTLLPRATDLYGFFAIVLGLMTWLFIGSNVTLLAAEVNVVLARRLWPRRLKAHAGSDPRDK